jgi:hypothetical protein
MRGPVAVGFGGTFRGVCSALELLGEGYMVNKTGGTGASPMGSFPFFCAIQAFTLLTRVGSRAWSRAGVWGHLAREPQSQQVLGHDYEQE